MNDKSQPLPPERMADHVSGSRTKDGTTSAGRAMNSGPPPDAISWVPQRPIKDQEVAPRVQSTGLDRDTLTHGLGLMAKYIDAQGRNLTIIIVGGATNTLLLQDRRYTPNVDLVATNIDSDQHRLLGRAAEDAARKSPARLGGEWFNNDFILLMPLPTEVCYGITREAFDQDEVVFRKKGLKVIAAPWRFALCLKMDRMSYGTGRPYDLSDAVSYLRRHIQKTNGAPVPVRTIRAWAVSYRKAAMTNAVNEVAAEYFRQYKSRGIVS